MDSRKTRLLVVTQTVDRDDDVLGFFHRWLEVFLSKFSQITVLALKKGKVGLPSNVSVYSLGKEKYELGIKNNELWKRIYYVIKFVRYIVQKRHDYDVVFVHMNEEYVLLGGLIWKLLGKKIFLWRNHRHGNFLTRVAVMLSSKVFCTSPFSFTAKFKKTVLMPVGVDTDFFKISIPISSRGKTLLSLGRIDPVKKIDVLSNALALIHKDGHDHFKLTIVGSPSSGNERYAALVRESFKPMIDKNIVDFVGPIYHEQTAEYFNRNFIFVNLTPTGSFDKTILEAMACGCLVIAANQSVFEIIGDDGQIDSINKEQVAQKILDSLAILPEEALRRSALNREFVLKNHSLKLLSDKLVYELKSV